MSRFRAWCPACKKLVSDDLVLHDDKSIESIHEHPVIIMMELMQVEPMQKTKVHELTAKAYFLDASKLDAELIVSRLKRQYNIPLGSRPLTYIVQEALTLLREAAVEDEKEHRAKLKGKKGPKSLKQSDEEPIDLDTEGT